MKPECRVKSQGVSAPPVMFGAASSLLAKVSPGAASFVAKRLFLHTSPYRMSKDEQDFLNQGMPIRLYDGRCTLHGWRWGNGPGILVVHGWSGRGAQFHEIALHLVARGYSVLGFDFPGHGLSKCGLPTMFDFVKSLEVIDKTYGPFHGVVAHSLGSLAVAVAKERGLLQEKSVFINALPSADYAVDKFAQMSGVSLATLRSMQRGLEKEYGTAFEQCDFNKIAPKISQQTLVIHDRYDRMTPWEGSQQWSKLLPQGEFMTTEKLGHQRILSNESVSKKVLDFFGPPQGNSRAQFLSEFAL